MDSNNKGSILMISLWILAILVIFAISLGYRCTINLRLAGYQKDRLRANLLAKAGINRAILEIKNNKNTYDALNQDWANSEKIFKKISFNANKNEYATVSYLVKNEVSGNYDNIYGATDEESKININNINPFGQQQLIELFRFVKLIDPEPEELKDVIVQWIDSSKKTDKEIFKNEPLKTPEELLLILKYFYQNKHVDNFDEEAERVFSTVNSLITVYGDGNVNINTASKEVLTILASCGKEKECRDDVVKGIIDARNTKPFETVDLTRMSWPADSCQANLFNDIMGNLTVKSNNFRIEPTGYVGNISKKIIAIYDRNQQKMVYWHEN